MNVIANTTCQDLLLGFIILAKSIEYQVRTFSVDNLDTGQNMSFCNSDDKIIQLSIVHCFILLSAFCLPGLCLKYSLSNLVR